MSATEIYMYRSDSRCIVRSSELFRKTMTLSAFQVTLHSMRTWSWSGQTRIFNSAIWIHRLAVCLDPSILFFASTYLYFASSSRWNDILCPLPSRSWRRKLELKEIAAVGQEAEYSNDVPRNNEITIGVIAWRARCSKIPFSYLVGLRWNTFQFSVKTRSFIGTLFNSP